MCKESATLVQQFFVADGGITEEGTHEELLAKNGAYANLFEVQSRYYREGGENNEEEN